MVFTKIALIKLTLSNHRDMENDFNPVKGKVHLNKSHLGNRKGILLFLAFAEAHILWLVVSVDGTAGEIQRIQMLAVRLK